MLAKRNITIIFVLFSITMLILAGCAPTIPSSEIQNIDTGIYYNTSQETIDAALDEIHKNRGILYDSEGLDACEKMFRENKFEFKSNIG